MTEVEFDYNGLKTIIQCNLTDIISIIINKFLIKCDKKEDNVCFLYNGQLLNKNITLNEIANNDDIKRKKMNIIVYDREEKKDKDNKSSLLKSKYIICPTCKDCINLSINDLTVSLNDCKMGHKFENISINDFEKT